MVMPAKPSKCVVAENVRRFRKARGLTQVQLSQRVGVEQSRISEIERAEYAVNLDTLDKLCDALEVGPAGLLVPVEIPEAIPA